MAIQEPQRLLPDNLIRSVRADVERLLNLTSGQRTALFKAMEQFTPSMFEVRKRQSTKTWLSSVSSSSVGP